MQYNNGATLARIKQNEKLLFNTIFYVFRNCITLRKAEKTLKNYNIKAHRLYMCLLYRHYK